MSQSRAASARRWLGRNAIRIYAVFAFAYLFIPVAYTLVFSFNDSGKSNLNWRGFTTDKWAAPCAAPDVCPALVNSVKIGLVATAIATGDLVDQAQIARTDLGVEAVFDAPGRVVVVQADEGRRRRRTSRVARGRRGPGPRAPFRPTGSARHRRIRRWAKAWSQTLRSRPADRARAAYALAELSAGS